MAANRPSTRSSHTPPRAECAFVQKYPWYTQVLMDNQKLAVTFSPDSPLRHLKDRILEFESKFFFAQSQDAKEVHQLLGYFPQHAIQVSALAAGARDLHALEAGRKASAPAADRLTALVLSYALLDQGHLHLAPPSTRNVIAAQTPMPAIPPKLNFLILPDWRVPVNDLRDGLKEFLSADVEPPRRSESTNVRHLKMLARLTRHGKTVKALYNIQLAALHLSCLNVAPANTSASDLWRDLPDLPPTLESLTNSLTEDERNALAPLFDKRTNMRLPLLLAVMGSWVLLLLPISLHKYSWNRYTLLLWWMCLGNSKPQELIALEGLIFQAVVHIACGRVDLLTAVQHMLNELPQAKLDSMPEPSWAWFRPLIQVPDQPETRETAAQEKEKAEQERAARELAEKERAEKEKAEQERAEKEQAERERAEQERAARELAEKERAEKEKAEQERAEKEQAERERAEKERAEKERAEKERAEREQAEKERAEKEKAEQERAEKEQAERERAEKERAEKEKAEQERAEKEQAEKEKAEKERAEKEKEKEQQAAKKKAKKDLAARKAENEAKNRTDKENARVNPLRENVTDPEHAAAGMDQANDGDQSTPSHYTEDAMDVDPVDDSDSDGRALRSVAKVDYAAMLGGSSSPPKKRKTPVQPDVNADFTIPAAEVATEEVSETLEDAGIEPFLSSVPCAYDTLPACGLFEDKLTTLDIDEIREVERSEETFTFHGPHGEPYDITPGQHTNLRDTTPNDANPHDLSPLQKVQAFFASAKKSYVGDTPLHVARPQESVFAIFSQSDFDRLPPAHVQDILRKQHIVTTDESITPLGFDRAALRAVHPLNAPVTVQDLSIPGDDFNVRLKEGTLAQVLQNSNNPNGKILNALQFPKPMDGLFRAPYSSSSAALDETVGAPDFKPEMAFDAGSLSWRIVGGKDAVHFWHIDCDGLGTMVQVLGGSNGGAKLWIVARPKGKFYDCGLFGNLQTFLREGFELDDPSDGPWAGADDTRWELEAIVLRPGSTLIMRPNTPHAVYTPVPTICRGVHFYATSTMQDTLFGIVHTLVAGTYVTNTQHITARRLIHRLVDLYHRGIVERTVDEESPAYAHIPSLQTLASAMDLIATCVLAILGNVLDTRTYLAPGASTAEPTEAQTQIYMQWDANEIHTFDRKAHVLARGKAYSIIREVNSRVEFVMKDGVVMDVESIVRAYLLQVCQAVMQYKELAESKEYEVMGASNCTKQLIMRQLRGLNNPQSSFQYIQVGDIGPGLPQTTLAFPFVDLTIRHISNAKAPEKVIDYMRSGVSQADALFHLGCNHKNRKDNPWKGIDPLGEQRKGDKEASDEHDGEDDRPPRKKRKTRSS